MKKKLLVMASTFPRWKNDTNPPFVYELSKRLVPDFDVTILAPHYPGAKTYEEMDGMKVYRFRYFFSPFEKLAGSGGILPMLKKNPPYYLEVPFFLLGEYLALRRLVKKIKPDVIHAHWIIPQGVIAYINSKISKTPYLVTTWGGDMFVFKRKGVFSSLVKKIYSMSLNGSKKATTVNKIFEKEMKSVCNNKKKIMYVSNGVDTEKFNPTKINNSIREKHKIKGPFLLFIGRLAQKKGIKYLIEAMPAIIKQNSQTKLLIIGTGPLEQELKHQAETLKLNNKIIFLGAISNEKLPEYYASADLFVAPSITTAEGDREGLPTVYLESMACGTHIVTTKIDGINEIIKNETLGTIVNQKSSKELSEAIIQLLKKHSQNRKFSYHWAKKNYDWRVVAEKYKRLLI